MMKILSQGCDIIESPVIIHGAEYINAAMLDLISDELRKWTNRKLPFGGLNVILSGNILKLVEVMEIHEEALIKGFEKQLEKYDSPYFFSAEVFRNPNYPLRFDCFDPLNKDQYNKLFGYLKKIKNGINVKGNINKITSQLRTYK